MTPSRNAPCPCGSGKKFKRCCGAGAPPARPQASAAQALEAFQRGDTAGALRMAEHILTVRPEDALAHYVLAHCKLREGPGDATAAQHFERAIHFGLRDPAAHYFLGVAQLNLGQPEAAVRALSAAVEMRPEFVQARNMLGGCLMTLQRLDEAERTFGAVLARDPGNTTALSNLGQICYLSSRVPEAISYLRRAAAADLGNAEVRARLATVLELDERLAEARQETDAALSIEPTNTTARIIDARLSRREGRYAQALDALDRSDLRRAPPHSAVAWWAERGEALDRLTRYQEAFEAYSASNVALADTTTADADVLMARLAARLAGERESLTEEWIDAHHVRHVVPAGQGTPLPAPIFIVGFFRSGTTLLEQMLSSHPDISACGELTALPAALAESGADAVFEQPTPDLTGTEALLDTIARDYLAELRRAAEAGRRYATDKLPLNLVRLAWIRLLFPGAKVIHVLRHPLDSVLSAYFNPFLHGNEWSLSLGNCARMFAESWRHGRHFGAQMKGDYLLLRYEDLVADPAGRVGDVLAFLDLPWHADCADNTRSNRIARTASYQQVRQAVHARSVERYRNYLSYIPRNVLEFLSPIIDECGYSI